MKRFLFCVLFLVAACGCTAVQFGGDKFDGVATVAFKAECNSIRNAVIESGAKIDKLMAKQGIPALTPDEISAWEMKAREEEKKAKEAAKERGRISQILHSFKWWLAFAFAISILAGIAHEIGTIKTGVPALDVAIHALGVVWHVIVAVAHVAWHIILAAWRIGFSLVKKIFSKINTPAAPTGGAPVAQ